MNREIKFRAWDIKDKFMMTFYDSEKQICHITPHRHSNIEIMQYTGLTDKNGKEIYEGDIIEYIDKDNSICYLIKYNQDRFGFGYYSDNYKKWYPLSKTWVKERKNKLYYKGNIYENPELLELTDA
jgi:uncharacterized phage protein (TIGR01671 family)